MRYHAGQFLSLLLLVSYLSACTSWQVQSAPTTSVLTKYAGKDVRVTTVDGRRIKIQRPTVSADTVFGRGKDTTSVAIPLPEVREVAVKRTDVPRTALLLVGIGVVGVIVTAAAICAQVCEN